MVVVGLVTRALSYPPKQQANCKLTLSAWCVSTPELPSVMAAALSRQCLVTCTCKTRSVCLSLSLFLPTGRTDLDFCSRRSNTNEWSTSRRRQRRHVCDQPSCLHGWLGLFHSLSLFLSPCASSTKAYNVLACSQSSCGIEWKWAWACISLRVLVCLVCEGGLAANGTG